MAAGQGGGGLFFCAGTLFCFTPQWSCFLTTTVSLDSRGLGHPVGCFPQLVPELGPCRCPLAAAVFPAAPGWGGWHAPRGLCAECLWESHVGQGMSAVSCQDPTATPVAQVVRGWGCTWRSVGRLALWQLWAVPHWVLVQTHSLAQGLGQACLLVAAGVRMAECCGPWAEAGPGAHSRCPTPARPVLTHSEWVESREQGQGRHGN